ncbi:MAG: deoxyguanosinetriphosphate triphosphohydrolase [Alkaliphilus sp.]
MNENLRELTETLEASSLAVYAELSSRSKGRKKFEEPCDIRTEFQRDRDKIIHSKSFRALIGKTQVFIVKDDFFRTRLTHTLEVSQIARTIARSLRLNEDLIEAIALGHDLGHTCFGHSGEEVLDRINGGFQHNEQSLRIVDVLEREGKGLNLTCEVRDGILNHTGQGIPVTMEGKLVKIVDRITYLCHDIQDSINAKIISESEIPMHIVDVLGDSHSKKVNTFVVDIVEETLEQLAKGNEYRIYQSDLLKETMKDLRSFMFEKVYNGKICEKEKEKSTFIVTAIYEYLIDRPEELPEEYSRLLMTNTIRRVVVDYIASLTDSRAIELFQQIFIPSPK